MCFKVLSQISPTTPPLPIFTKLVFAFHLFVKNDYTEFRENASEDLVADILGQRRMELVSA